MEQIHKLENKLIDEYKNKCKKYLISKGFNFAKTLDYESLINISHRCYFKDLFGIDFDEARKKELYDNFYYIHHKKNNKIIICKYSFDEVETLDSVFRDFKFSLDSKYEYVIRTIDL
jgi:hypothetical protein